MAKQITIDMLDSIYDGLEQFAQDRGLSIAEGVKWLLGDFVLHNVGATTHFAMPGIAQGSGRSPVPLAPPTPTWNKMYDLANLWIIQQILKSNPHCPNCDKDLTLRELTKNECSQCKQKVI